MTYLLGIDVGTTRTAAAIRRMGARPGEAEAVNLGDRASSVPSVIYVADSGSVLVGEAAERRAVTDPDRVVREFKRRIGDPTPIVVGGRPWSPEDLSARLVRWVADQVAQREGGPAARIAVTHPASWGEHKKERLGAALAAQGISVSFLAEPQAAALHYAAAERVEPGSTIAVYDLGGGTFDAAVVHKDRYGGFGLVGRPEGLERLGGIDFDEAVFEHVRAGLPAAFDGLDESDPAALAAVAAVRRECAEAKEALSSDTEVTIPVLMPGARGSVRLHRSEFEAMIRPQVEETVDALRRAIGSAGLAPGQLSAVLLVGGSSRIPLVGQLVSELLGRPIAVDADPKNAIAMGAALSLAPTPAPRIPAPRSSSPSRMPIGAAAMSSDAFVPGQARHDTGDFGGQSGPQPPSQRVAQSGAVQSGAVQSGTAQSGTAQSGSVQSGAVHSGTAAGAMAPPPPRPAASPPARPPIEHGDGDAEYEYSPPPPPTGQSAVRMISIGGAVAAVAVVAGVFLWPGADRNVGPIADAGPPSSTLAPSSSPAPATTTTAAPTTSRAPVRPPVVTSEPEETTEPPATTEPPVTTTTQPKPTTTEPTEPTTEPSSSVPTSATQPTTGP